MIYLCSECREQSLKRGAIVDLRIKIVVEPKESTAWFTVPCAKLLHFLKAPLTGPLRR